MRRSCTNQSVVPAASGHPYERADPRCPERPDGFGSGQPDKTFLTSVPECPRRRHRDSSRAPMPTEERASVSKETTQR